MLNAIFLRRRRKLLVTTGMGSATLEHLATMQKEVAALGFVLSDALLLRLRAQSPQQLASMLRELLRDLRPMVGARRDGTTLRGAFGHGRAGTAGLSTTAEPPPALYPGFPGQTMRMPEAERYLESVRQYVAQRRAASFAVQTPASQNGDVPTLEGREPELIDVGTRQEFEVICTQLAGARTSLSAQDRADLAWFVRQYRGDVLRLLPPRIPAETLALVAAQLIDHVDAATGEALMRSHGGSATDVLRLAVALGRGDVSLAKPARFASMPRARRRLLLSMIDERPDAAEAMRVRPERWKRLGEALHPREFAPRWPRAQAAFAALREGRAVPSARAEVEAALRERRTGDAIAQLCERPIEFARRLDHVLRLAAHNPAGANDSAAVLEAFARVAPKVSTPVLLQVLAHVRHRGRHPMRAFLPHGRTAQVYAIRETRAPLSPVIGDALAARVEDTLVDRFRLLPPLGSCHLDPELAFHFVPSGHGSSAPHLRTLAHGSRPALLDARCLRLFLWWANGRAATDIDLSAGFYRSDFAFAGTLSYYNLRDFGCHHSGDVIDAPNGAAEFIDLDVDYLVSRGIRFVVMSLEAYGAQTFRDLSECFAGWTARRGLGSGEPFEPRSVVDRVDLTADTRIALPAAFDLVGKRVLWMDAALNAKPRWNTSNHNLSGVSLMLRALGSMPRPDLYTLFSLHVRARGSVVSDRQRAQTIFTVDRAPARAPAMSSRPAAAFVSPLDTDRIRDEFMA